MRSLLLIILLSFASFAGAQTPVDDKAVRAVIDQYFRGQATGDPDEMRKPFLASAHIEGNRNGVFTSWTVDQYAGNFSGKPAADEASRKRTIHRVEISGTAAIASATLVHGATTFTDYFRAVEGERRMEDRQQGLLVSPDEVKATTWGLTSIPAASGYGA